MIIARFYKKNNEITGFEIKGHSGTAEKGRDIICAAVSSAALMTANTITECYGISALCECRDGYLKCIPTDYLSAKPVLEGLCLHLRNLANDYPYAVKIIYGGNKDA